MSASLVGSEMCIRDSHLPLLIALRDLFVLLQQILEIISKQTEEAGAQEQRQRDDERRRRLRQGD
eukprot:5229111-Alexandrium_andersonii.AAC.1